MAAEVLADDLETGSLQGRSLRRRQQVHRRNRKAVEPDIRRSRTTNAILFFDEADALFGKRTEVKDAHDRYANVEIRYLLQKMEEYEGIVILATNFRGNMDDAFTRRMRFIVEFPFPDEANCLRIWKTHFPASAPVSPDIDYAYLARELRLPGGNIKNIVLSAAFLAAEMGRVGMQHILHGGRRDTEKMGKIWRQPSSASALSHWSMVRRASEVAVFPTRAAVTDKPELPAAQRETSKNAGADSAADAIAMGAA